MQGKKQILSEDQVRRVQELRREGHGFTPISRMTGICYSAVERACFDVVPETVLKGRSTFLSAEDQAEIVRLRAEGAPLRELARRFRISVDRLRNICEAATCPGSLDRIHRYEPSAARRVATLHEDMIRSGVPITPIHIEACRGHSRQWMRLYMLRVRNPDYRDNLEAADAVPRRHLCALHF